jgi:hypothetical protein
MTATPEISLNNSIIILSGSGGRQQRPLYVCRLLVKFGGSAGYDGFSVAACPSLPDCDWIAYYYNQVNPDIEAG